MNNDTANTRRTNSSSDSNNPQDEANNNLRDKMPGSEEIKEYGKKSLAPLIDMVSKYRSEINPYFSAIGKGLQSAINSFNNQGQGDQQMDQASIEAEQAIAGWFRDANDWFTEVNKKIQAGNSNELLDYLEQQAQRHPAMMFSTSYIAGLVFGRLGRHLGRQFTKGSTGSFDESSSFGDQDYSSDTMKH